MLIDTIIRYAQLAGYDERLVYGLSMAARFQVDNVAQYFHETTKVGKRCDIRKEMPNIAPVAPVMWFEYGGLAIGKEAYKQFGCLLSIDYGVKEGICAKKWEEFDVPMEIHWILRAEYFFSDQVGIHNSDWVYYHSVKEDGAFLNCDVGENKRRSHATGDVKWVPDEIQREKLHEEIAVAFLSLCFSHCKGTEIREHQPSRQVRRAAERTGKPVFTFHTIDIDPSTNALRTEGHVSENGLARALHICRGHFAHYTEDKKLFGKYAGTFWKPQHVRGSQQIGIAAKDYRIKKPKGEPLK